ncbi:ubiquitin carboxyl-terminal hydrolase 14 [Pseudomassariella vexata]|uniref:Ubiquitin carboxyl-terminal hydrolase n=1 Tax=Pseudomassariella vexata TaxID=1141098 RepID=A0A1Y2DAZ7_9PEZI|nr:ubiquitin carboxyl-terminal hydrolase 14 [Pseudomassariella vexata]ORY56367.1 ubiquitin carboxyl-terminal hydrolase 14 [Pseudomassariella vexata]
MACPHLESISLSPPTAAQSVYREDCTQCFDSIDDPTGLDVCLQCFNGGCTGVKTHSQLHHSKRDHPLALNIRRTRKQIVRDEPPAKMTKLAISAETEADRYDVHTSAKCLSCDTEIDLFNPKIAPVIDGIMKANTFSRQEEVKAWEQELSTCEHTLMLQQHESRKIESGDLGHCSKCELKENLWLCLECGNLGCGRAQFGGVGGNSHGLAHANESSHGVAVKLGSITPEGTADVYCYKCDDERVDNDLAPHLAHWGIILSDQVKTEKSLTEMQIEQNLRWEFAMTTEDGKELQPIFGPGLTGLKNLGNSCYLASILQCLFALEPFQDRYNRPGAELPNVPDPAQDLETQLCKIGDGLLSGRYSKPDPEVVSSDSSAIHHQRGLAPSMFKHLIGRGHAEFSTMRQQDSFELLQHLIKLITRTQHPAPLSDPTQPLRFILEQRLQCLSCKKVRYSSNEQDSIFIDVPLEKLPSVEGEGERYKEVTLKQCLDNLTASEVVELTCAGCGSKDGFTKRSLFKTFPGTLVVNARKMAIENWVPRKVDVPVIIGEGPFSLDAYMSHGHQPDEILLPEENTAAAPAFVPNQAALEGLMAMGFPKNRCDKALHATGNNDMNAALEWIMMRMDDPSIDEPFVLPCTSGSTAEVDPQKIEQVCNMGFSVPQARKALKETGSDVERAIDWIFNHMDDQGDYGDDAPDLAESAEPKEKKEAGNADLPANFELHSIVCHKGSSIHAGHYVAFIRKIIDTQIPKWVLFNDEKVVEAGDIEEMKKTAYVYFFNRVH